MLSNTYFLNTIRFMFLVLVQTLVFNRLNFMGFINPMVYLLFLYWYPVNSSRTVFLGTAFLLGLAIDFFSDSMALHAAAAVTVAYLRPAIMRFCFGVNYEFQSFKVSGSTQVQQMTFLALLIIVHHCVYFLLEVFSFENILLILKKIVATSCATFVLCMLFNSLFSVDKE